jgi:hypothetical protein
MKPNITAKITYWLFLIALLVLIFPAISHGQEYNAEGIYVSSDGQRRLEVKPNGSFNLTYNDEFLANTTVWHLKDLGYGQWRKKGEFLIFNSSDDIKSDVLNIIVEEESISNDSLKIEIINPYESEEGSSPLRIFKYEISLFSPHVNIGDKFVMDKASKSFLVSKEFNLNGIIVYMVPDPFYYPNKLAFNFLSTTYYTVKNPKSNYFKISIPDFTLEYIGYMRFKNEYIKIVDDKTLLVRGERFIATE